MMHHCPACRSEVDARALAEDPICPVCGGWIDREPPADGFFAEESPTRPSLIPAWSEANPPSDPRISVEVVPPRPSSETTTPSTHLAVDEPPAAPRSSHVDFEDVAAAEPDVRALSVRADDLDFGGNPFLSPGRPVVRTEEPAPVVGGSLRPLATDASPVLPPHRGGMRRLYGSAAVAVGLGLFCAWKLTDSSTTEYPNTGSGLEDAASALGAHAQMARDEALDEPPPATMRSAALDSLRVAEAPASVEVETLPPFDREAAERALDVSAPDALACAEYGLGGEASIEVTFASSGHVVHAAAAPPFAGTPAGGCLEATSSEVVLPAFDGEAVTMVRRVQVP